MMSTILSSAIDSMNVDFLHMNPMMKVNVEKSDFANCLLHC